MRVLVTGGAGFIGCNAAKRFLEQKDEVIIFDDLSRRGADKNLRWLRTCTDCKTTSLDRRDISPFSRGQVCPAVGGASAFTKATADKRKPRLSEFHEGLLTFIKGDVRNSELLNMLFSDPVFGKIDLILHMAAQVAVTTSIDNPREDFEVNALGTFNLLEAIRNSKQRPIIINASTNKVYGKMELAGIVRDKTRYRYKKLPRGISEDMPLDFYSPYGCSKGAADQYILDYSRIYGIKTINFRQSCIYGTRQFGVEDQGWAAHFIISVVKNRPITIYGDGKQVRDILYIDDLVDAFLLAFKRSNVACGKSYNIGGGPDNSISLLEFVALLEDMLRRKIPVKFRGWRAGDQKVYISDVGRAKKDLGWRPKISIENGTARLVEWVQYNKGLFDDF